jgi:hypothetical protein
MPRQLVDHPLTVDLMLGGVVEDVKTDESTEQVIELHLPHLSNFVDVETTSTLACCRRSPCGTFEGYRQPEFVPSATAMAKYNRPCGMHVRAEDGSRQPIRDISESECDLALFYARQGVLARRIRRRAQGSRQLRSK